MTVRLPAEVPAIVIRRSTEALQQLRAGTTMVLGAPAVFRVEGPGAVECLQGVLSNDVIRPGADSVVYAATLTNKGMIIADFWVLRDQQGVTLIADRSARGEAAVAFSRQLPPRLARVTDHSETWGVAWLLGDGAGAAVGEVGLRWPAAGHLAVDPGIPAALVVARPGPGGPCEAMLVGPVERLPVLAGQLGAHGVRLGEPEDLETVRILRGWPRLRAEIGERTLPQEVRFDELGGVSYTKGCYTGQETVARLHFRGRPNWLLLGLAGDGPAPATAGIIADGREAGTVRSVLALEDRWLATASLRREVEPGATVLAGGHAATVMALPFEQP